MFYIAKQNKNWNNQDEQIQYHSTCSTYSPYYSPPLQNNSKSNEIIMFSGLIEDAIDHSNSFIQWIFVEHLSCAWNYVTYWDTKMNKSMSPSRYTYLSYGAYFLFLHRFVFCLFVYLLSSPLSHVSQSIVIRVLTDSHPWCLFCIFNWLPFQRKFILSLFLLAISSH